ncbi:hypothetical protein BDA96_05G198000 [Sorghum bicolor]|uniref:Uncharacterized protein n=2 Tax=Sorghum bicolor TaxID=4558 RepID=A0A921R092_SORBI|nr:hypothetical protein BDA96_05G198000 [Sorghum bicolor]KXG28907.1 hypothetical protein SORBI_3005G182000 [Sorghum bicolor]
MRASKTMSWRYLKEEVDGVLCTRVILKFFAWTRVIHKILLVILAGKVVSRSPHSSFFTAPELATAARWQEDIPPPAKEQLCCQGQLCQLPLCNPRTSSEGNTMSGMQIQVPSYLPSTFLMVIFLTD